MPFVGFVVTIGEIIDPAVIERTYQDIDKIFKANPDKFYVKEEKTPDGKFKAFHVSTEPL